MAVYAVIGLGPRKARFCTLTQKNCTQFRWKTRNFDKRAGLLLRPEYYYRHVRSSTPLKQLDHTKLGYKDLVYGWFCMLDYCALKWYKSRIIVTSKYFLTILLLFPLQSPTQRFGVTYREGCDSDKRVNRKESRQN